VDFPIKDGDFFWDGACFSLLSNIARWSFPAAAVFDKIARIMNLGGDEMKQAKAKLEELGSPWGRHGHLGVWKDLVGVKHDWIMFHFIYGMSSFPFTNSIIFQDG